MKKKIVIGSVVGVGCLLIVALVIAIFSLKDIPLKEKTGASDGAANSASGGTDQSAVAEQVTVPDVCSLSREEAEKTLKDLGFSVTVNETFSSTTEKGKIVSQSIAGGTTVAKNTSIVIAVSKGEDLVKAPDIVGKTKQEAVELMEKAGLELKTDIKCSSKVKEGKIISQDVEAGQQINRDSTVTAYISAGVSNEYGTTNFNNNNFCNVAVQGNWIYYINTGKDYGLYKMRKDGTDRQFLAGSCTSVNVLGEWIYYGVNSGTDKGVYKIKLDGSEKVKLNSADAGWLYVTKDWIYYANWKFDSPIYRMKHDGSSQMTVCSEECTNANVVGNSIFYLNKDGSAIYRIGTDGSDKVLIAASNEISDLMYDGGKLYVTDGDDRIIVFNEDGTRDGVYRSKADQIWFSGAYDGWVYYYEITHNDETSEKVICRAKPDFSERQELYRYKEDNAMNNNFTCYADGWIYFPNFDEGGVMNRVNVSTGKVQNISQ